MAFFLTSKSFINTVAPSTPSIRKTWFSCRVKKFFFTYTTLFFHKWLIKKSLRNDFSVGSVGSFWVYNVVCSNRYRGCRWCIVNERKTIDRPPIPPSARFGGVSVFCYYKTMRDSSRKTSSGLYVTFWEFPEESSFCLPNALSNVAQRVG